MSDLSKEIDWMRAQKKWVTSDEIIAKVLDSELASEKAKAWLDIRAAQERAKTIERVLEAIERDTAHMSICRHYFDAVKASVKGVGDE